MKKIILGVLLLLSAFVSNCFALISVSPLKFEYTVNPWSSQDWVIIVTNNEKNSLTLYSSKEDFVAWDDKWNPKFMKAEESAWSLFGLTNWITIEQENITLAPWESREVKFTVKVPENGEPWGHYWAIFFSQWGWEWQVSVVARLWVLLLINVPWAVKVDWTLQNFDVWKKSTESWKESFVSTTDFDYFPIYFPIKFKNAWNVHIKPQWKIVILDENGQQLSKIWKETLTSPTGVYLWEQMVDYLPVNDSNWNVLPASERIFEWVWQGFWYQELNADGTKAVKFRSLEEFYNQKAQENRKYLKLWEQEKQVKVKKKFTAQLSISYESKDWEKKDFNQQKDFYVTYTDTVVWINNYIIWGLILVIVFLIYYFTIWRKKFEENLRKKLMEQMESNKS